MVGIALLEPVALVKVAEGLRFADETVGSCEVEVNDAELADAEVVDEDDSLADEAKVELDVPLLVGARDDDNNISLILALDMLVTLDEVFAVIEDEVLLCSTSLALTAFVAAWIPMPRPITTAERITATMQALSRVLILDVVGGAGSSSQSS